MYCKLKMYDEASNKHTRWIESPEAVFEIDHSGFETLFLQVSVGEVNPPSHCAKKLAFSIFC